MTAKRKPAVPLVISANNLTLRYGRGEVEVAKVADPESPNRTFLRPRLRDPVRMMWQARGVDEDGNPRGITDAQYVAALRYRDDHSLAEGVREEQGGGLAPWQRTYSDLLLDAIKRRREALQAIGITLSPVFVSAVVEHEPLDAMATRLRVGNRRVAAMLRSALDRLAAHYR